MYMYVHAYAYTHICEERKRGKEKVSVCERQNKRVTNALVYPVLAKTKGSNSQDSLSDREEDLDPSSLAKAAILTKQSLII